MVNKQTLTGICILLSAADLGCSQYDISNPNPAYFRKVHRDIWRNGGVCRHAAVAISELADESGLENEIMLFDMRNSTNHHAIPIVRIDNVWYAFESKGNSRYWTSRSRGTQNESQLSNPQWYEHILYDRRKLNSVLGIASEERKNEWSKELNELYPLWRQNNGIR